MTFQELYLKEKAKPTAAEQFVTRMAEICENSEYTVRMWIAGKQIPNRLAQKVIAEELGVDINELFPVQQ